MFLQFCFPLFIIQSSNSKLYFRKSVLFSFIYFCAASRKQQIRCFYIEVCNTSRWNFTRNFPECCFVYISFFYIITFLIIFSLYSYLEKNNTCTGEICIFMPYVASKALKYYVFFAGDDTERI